MKLIAQAATKTLPAIVGEWPNDFGKGLGGFANRIALSNYQATTANIISMILGFLTIVAGLWFMIQFILGAVTWISAGGDKGKTTQAKDKITQAVVGLAIVVGAYAIAGLIGTILGLDFLNIGAALKNITP